VKRIIGLMGLAMLVPGPLAAQNAQTISANNPQAMTELLELTGFNPKLGKDETGDPRIDLDVDGYYPTIFFYGCDQKTHTGCDSVQFHASFDRKDPWPASEAVKVASRWRFGGVYLSESGDPRLTFDVVTGDGIPSKVFLQSLRGYMDTLDEVANLVFPDDGSQDTKSD
jgi:hypothetical protein